MRTTVDRACRIMALPVLITGLSAASTLDAMAADDAGGWTFAMQPYLWTPVIGARFTF